jgi:hypothetical protein
MKKEYINLVEQTLVKEVVRGNEFPDKFLVVIPEKYAPEALKQTPGVKEKGYVFISAEDNLDEAIKTLRTTILEKDTIGVCILKPSSR